MKSIQWLQSATVTALAATLLLAGCLQVPDDAAVDKTKRGQNPTEAQMLELMRTWPKGLKFDTSRTVTVTIDVKALSKTPASLRAVVRRPDKSLAWMGDGLELMRPGGLRLIQGAGLNRFQLTVYQGSKVLIEQWLDISADNKADFKAKGGVR